MRAVIVAAFVLGACATRAPAPDQARAWPEAVAADMAALDRALAAPDVVVAAIGETADLGGGLSVRPLEVIEDSRCPRDVLCVWQGRLRLRALVNGREEILAWAEAFDTPRGGVTLAIVSPGRWSEWTHPEPPPPYHFGFRRD